MEIPHSSLVDGLACKIGLFSEDQNWWNSLKEKRRKNLPSTEQLASHNQLKIENDLSKTSGNTPRKDLEVEDFNSDLTHSKAMLVETELGHKMNQKKDVNMILDNSMTPEMILEKEKELQMNIVNNSKVIGETPLHIAIMHEDLATLTYLIEEKGLDVNQRTSAETFQNGFERFAKEIEKSEYKKMAYYGEYPICLAACFASKEIYDYLIDKGADPNQLDSNGNGLLHTLVINDKLEMFLYASNHPKLKADLTLKNNQGLTPFNLAAKLAKSEIFEKMLEINEIMIWQYSNILCSVYPLDSIDTIKTDGSIDPLASLAFIVNGDTDDHLEMLRVGFIDRLLEDKWAQFAQTLFFKKMVISALHLIFLSIAVYTRAGDYPYPAKSGASANTVVRYMAESLTFIGCIGILVVQGTEAYKQGLKEYFINLLGEPANVFYNLFCILIILAFPWRFINTGSEYVSAANVEDTFVILAIPCAWMHLLFYARVATLTGPFVVMIYKMVVGDIATFSIIFVIFLFGFSLGFFYLYKDAGHLVVTLKSYQEALFQSFLWTLGEYKARLPEFDRVLHSDLLKIIFVVFSLFLHIMLFNMLIAMMGNTYSIINAKSEKEWRKQWAHSILLLEQTLTNADRINFQNKYCMQLPNPKPDGPDIPVLMVIKKVAKTKSMIYRRTMTLWKTSTRAVRDKLRFHRCKGIDLLDLWANKSSKLGSTRKPVDWSLYGGAPKNRPPLKAKATTEVKPLPEIKDEE